ncbi:methyltransferase domain-containing protein [Candidatus Daviesbacteria bacterium]|nr:methyltransferase domain-containing protein [Candidatus Daviesbacteria bacterium]
MTTQIQAWVQKTKKDFIKRPGKFLEIGSKDITGNIRQFFADSKEYIGTDAENGFGVDLIINAHDLLKRFKTGSFDGVLCMEMLEHDNAPWITIEIMHKLLKKGGFLIVSTPTFGFPLHRHPKDYFRFGEDAFREIIFKGFKIFRLSEVKDFRGSPAICCIGKKI